MRGPKNISLSDKDLPPSARRGLAVTFSIPFENSGLREDALLPVRLKLWYLGIGRATATAALATYLTARARTSSGKKSGEVPWLLVISGFAGALHPQIRVGDVFLCENVSDPHAIQSLLALGWSPPPSANLHTSEKLVVSSSQKAYLRQTTGSDLVDMESYSLFEIARFHSIPVITLRAVSDDATMDFPVPEHILYDRRRQCTRPLALCVHLTMNPRRIPGFMAMWKASLCARVQLGLQLRSVLQVASKLCAGR